MYAFKFRYLYCVTLLYLVYDVTIRFFKVIGNSKTVVVFKFRYIVRLYCILYMYRYVFSK